MVKVGGRRMVQSVPKELDRDGATLMDAAQVPLTFDHVSRFVVNAYSYQEQHVFMSARHR